VSAERYVFGEVTVDVTERRVTRSGNAVALPPKAHDVLVCLVRRAGHLVTKRELLDTVWPDAFVEEGSLAVHVSALRKALGDDCESARYIETVAKTGYRFVAAIDRPPASLAGPVARHAAPLHTNSSAAPAQASVGGATGTTDAVCRIRSGHRARPDPRPAHAGLALARCAQAEPDCCHRPMRTSSPRMALHALAMDDESADAMTALGAVMFLSE
jgi:DNA-binding winged helix-turn-helix (wHTH) protein